MIIRWKPAVTGLAVALGLASVGIAVQQQLAQQQASQPAGGRHNGGGPVPVVAGTVGREDVPIWLDGIGTVQAFNSVVVRVRVDGELQQVAFTEGQTVQAGDVLARIDPRPLQAQLAQAEAKKAQDEAQLANARRDLERNLGLREYASRQQVDTQRALVAQFEALVRSDDAAIETVKVQLGYTTITAPIGGRIGLRGVDQGNIVRAGDQNGLASITQVQPISVLFTLPEQALPAVLDAQAAGAVKVVAFDRAGKAPLGEGTLSVVDNQIDPGTGTVRLKATFPNDLQRLWPGQFVNVRLLASTRKDGTVVPASVVQRGPQGTYAYVIKEDQTVEQRTIKVARSEEGKALIDDGLKPGERVVVDGQYRLQPGSRVAASEPGAASPPFGDAPSGERRRERQNRS
ncbi:MAG TPA: efflux RND transporter periplasmic adaptor subunit [Azospirillum sp.]|nr:efflux RND transporter periplasmic adaptor subunit [Azospirillum sp.]